MASKFYDVTDMKTGNVLKAITAKEFQEMVGKNVVVSKYCLEGKPYMKRWKIETSDKRPEEIETNNKIKSPFDQKLYDEWNTVMAMFKNVEWVGGNHEQKQSKQVKRLSVCCK